MNEELKLTPEQAALVSEAASVDSQIAPTITHDENGQPIAQAPEQKIDPVARNRDLLTMGIMMLNPVAPFLSQCYTPEVIESIAGAFTAVEIKRGWDVQKYMSEELVLVLVTMPPTIKAYVLGKQYIEALREQNTIAARQQQQAQIEQPTAPADIASLDPFNGNQ